MDINTVSPNQDGVSSGPVMLTADEVRLVSGGVKVEFDVPPHIYVPIMAGHIATQLAVYTPSIVVFGPGVAMNAALGLFDAWAEPVLSNTRKNN